jgi:spore coat polysaccharide biosynthesis protein SpsF (cytidylyltransferase family)
MNKKITAIVQARIGSNRLRGKVIKKIIGKETILLLLKRLSLAKEIDDIIVAIPNKSQDDVLYNILKKNNFKVFRGSEKNVLNRYYECAKKFSSKNILRITGDCPLVDPKLVDKLANIFKKNKYDYVSNVEKRTFPDGMDIEIFSFKSLEIANSNVVTNHDKEHVTQYFLRSDIFKRYNYYDKQNFSNLRITLDTSFDFELIKKIFNKFKNKMFYYEDIISFYKKNKGIYL